MPCGCRATHDGHAQVQNDQIRLEFTDLQNGLLAVFCFAANIPIIIEKEADSFSNEFVIVNDKNTRNQKTPSLRLDRTGVRNIILAVAMEYRYTFVAVSCLRRCAAKISACSIDAKVAQYFWRFERPGVSTG